MIRLLLTLLVLLGMSTASAASFADPSADLARLADLVEERRALMDEVAAWKWQQQRAITDPAREEQLLADVARQAQSLGLQPASVRAFFELQIRWARELQERAFEQYRDSGNAPTDVADLSTELRPRLDRIGVELMQLLYVIAPHLQRDPEVLLPTIHARAVTLTTDERAALTQALRAIRLKPVDALSRIRASGVLRVGLTGDYAPFSLERNDQVSGADVDLAHALVEQLNVKLRIVKTSWPTLMADLQAGYFDVAAGGISITPDRQAIAAFGPVYHAGGKTSIVRCGREQAFDTVQEINQPGVRVVVNPGGTNERFAREQLGRAQLRVIPDNRRVFDEIVAGRADVMVTDDIEVDLQTRRTPALCRATAGTFTRSEKAWMLPAASSLEPVLAGWMSQQIAATRVQAALERHMHH